MKNFNFTRNENNVFNSSEDLKLYLSAGKGCIELKSPSGKFHDYLFSKPNSTYFPEDVIFVYAIHRDSKLFYIGMIERGIFRLTNNSRFLNDTEIVRGARYIIKLSKSEYLFQTSKMTITHLGICGRCGRRLHSNSYQGFGYKCYKKMRNEHATEDQQ